MLFRQALKEETMSLFEEGYKEWQKGRTFEQYCADNGKEDAYGTRYVVEDGGVAVSSLILLRLKEMKNKKAYGIGSVLTPKIYAGKGYASFLLKNCIKLIEDEDCLLFLFSDIDPKFYEKFKFRALPASLQKYKKSVFMVYCSDESFEALSTCAIESLPDYF